MRRLRTAFSLFRPVIADTEYERLREELRWFTGELGDARNLDVLLNRLATSFEGREGEQLRERLEAARERAYAQVREALASLRLRRLMLDLVAWIETGSWRANEDARKPLAEFAVRRLDRRWRTVRRSGKIVTELEAEPLHRLRIEVKKLRYAIEFTASIDAEGRQRPIARPSSPASRGCRSSSARSTISKPPANCWRTCSVATRRPRRCFVTPNAS